MQSFRRGRAAAFAAAYFVTNVAAAHAVEKSLWEERRVALRRTIQGTTHAPVVQVPLAGSLTVFDGGSTPSQPPSNFFKTALPFDAASAVFPYGTLNEIHEGRRGAPVVFLVQDVHGNDGAQKNIGGLLTDWAARGVTVVGVEGAWGPINLSAYHRHPSPRSVSAVADALRTAGWLSGAEWAGLTSPQPISLAGIESPDLYRDNVKAARACVARRADVAEFLAHLRQFLQAQKDLCYSPELISFDHSVRAYRNGQGGLADHVRFLARLPGAESHAGVQVKRFLKALEWESRLSFTQADVEKRGLMDRLGRCLDPRHLNTLLNQAMAYRAGKITNGDFYSYLINLCALHHIPLKAYPAFSDYLVYVGVVQSIRRGDLLRELDRWETDLANGLAKSPEERRLLALDADAVLLTKLLENEMSPESWSLFLQRRSQVMALPALLRERGEFQGPQEGLAALSHPHEEFCRLAIERNKALASHFLAGVLERKADHGVLVAGGFHTPGLQEELARHGCSTVVITPRVEKVEGKPLDVFARDPLPLDQLFAGKPISLSPELMMGRPEGGAMVSALVKAHAMSEKSHPAGEGFVHINLDRGARIVAGTSAEISQLKIRSMKKILHLDVSNGKSIAVFIPVAKISVLELAVNWLQWFFPLQRLTQLYVVPMKSGNPARTWTEYWGLGKRSMAGRHGYNSTIDGFFEKFFQNSDPKSRLLDVGGGAGYLGNLALKTSREFDVVELDPASVPDKSRFFGLRYLRAAAEKMPFAGGSFDGLMDAYALAYTDMDRSIEEMFRVLKPGGKAAILLHSENSDLVEESKRKHDALRQMGWNELILSKIEEYFGRETSLSRKKELLLEFIELYASIVRNNSEEDGDKNAAYGPLDILVNLLFHQADRAHPLAQIYRVSFSIWDQLFRAAQKVPTEQAAVARLFSRAGFVVDRIEVSEHEGFVQGWEVELTKPQFQFHVSRSGLTPRVGLSGPSGSEVASAVLGGQRGSVELRNIVVAPGDQSFAQEMLAGVAKEFLLLKGQGRLMLCKVKDPRLKRAAVEMFGDSLVAARNGFGRSLGNGPWEDAIDPTSDETIRLFDDPTVELDLAGSLTPAARQSLWPNEDLPALAMSDGTLPDKKVEFVPVKDFTRTTEDLGPGLREMDLFDVVSNGEGVGTIIFSKTAKTVWLRDIRINEDKRQNGFAKAIYTELAGRAGLLLNPERNKNGEPVALAIKNITNPINFSAVKGHFKKGTMEVVNVGSRAANEHFDPVANWETPILEGTREFDALVGQKNIDGSGQNKGKYRNHFNIRGQVQPTLIEEAERQFLQLQSRKPIANSARALSGESPASGSMKQDSAFTLTPRSALDTLEENEKRRLIKALENLMPRTTDMGGVEVSVGSPLLSTAPNQETSAHNTDSKPNGISRNEVQKKLSDPSVGAIVWAGLFALLPSGESSLRAVVEENGGTGMAQMVGAAMGALDDAVRFPHGPDLEKMAGILSRLFQRPDGNGLDSLQSFVDSYNHVRSVLLSVRLVGGALAGKKALLDLTALFDAVNSTESSARKEATWLVLAGALLALRQNGNSQFGFVVRDKTVTRETVLGMIQKNVPKASMDRIGDSLILASENNGGVFPDGRFSLGGLRATTKSWEGALQLVGFEAASVLESQETLRAWGAEILPMGALLGAEMMTILRKLKFIQISA